MKPQIAFRLLVVACILGLSACGSKVPVYPTLAWTPHAVTVTPQGVTTPTPTRRAGMPLGERQMVPAGGYSIQVPVNLDIKINNEQTVVSNQDDSLMIIFGITPRKNITQTLKSGLAEFLYNMKTIKSLKSAEAVPVQVNGSEGLAAEVTGKVLKLKGAGRVTLVEYGQRGFFYVIAFMADGPEGNRWETEGRKTYEAVLNALKFDQ
ncbi:MAG TPA: hypothetical protein VGK00_10165 [Anaerolineales bacterium]|jgi:hypothetical protein